MRLACYHNRSRILNIRQLSWWRKTINNFISKQNQFIFYQYDFTLKSVPRVRKKAECFFFLVRSWPKMVSIWNHLFFTVRRINNLRWEMMGSLMKTANLLTKSSFKFIEPNKNNIYISLISHLNSDCTFVMWCICSNFVSIAHLFSSNLFKILMIRIKKLFSLIYEINSCIWGQELRHLPTFQAKKIIPIWNGFRSFQVVNSIWNLITFKIIRSIIGCMWSKRAVLCMYVPEE